VVMTAARRLAAFQASHLLLVDAEGVVLGKPILGKPILGKPRYYTARQEIPDQDGLRLLLESLLLESARTAVLGL
jgi:hypothetical protein